MLRAFCLVLTTVAVGAICAAASQQQQVADFRLLDHTGRSHQLYRHGDAEAIVLFFQGNGSRAARRGVQALKALRESVPRDVRILLINPVRSDDRSRIAREMEGLEADFPVLLDDAQLVTRNLGVEQLGETLVIDTDTWRIVYRGGVIGGGGHARGPLRNALEAHLAGEDPARRQTNAAGRPINFAPWPQSVSYAKDVAPILKNNCLTCHVPGAVAPFSLTSYRKAAGWATMIREVVMTDRMPPWHADPAHGEFKNNRTLRPEEKRTLIAWIDDGAPRGDGPDPLAEYTPPAPSEWTLGEPGRVIEMESPFEIPAEGIVEYQLIEVPTNFTEDRWAKGIEILPGNRDVLHHCLVFIAYPEQMKVFEPHVSAGARGYFAGYVPGAEPHFYPENTGKLIPAGATFIFQLHYITTGRPETDQTRMGIHFHDEPPAERLVTRAAYNAEFEIPPRVRNFEVSADHRVRHDVTLYGMAPHMHYRGKRMRYTAEYPDGSSEVLLSVPNYIFDWQTMYVLEEAKQLPRGTRIVCEGAFDNSTTNPYNPDPDDTVYFGDQTYQEMFIGYMAYSAPVGTFFERAKNAQEREERERQAFLRKHGGTLAPPALSEKELIGTLWTEGEWKFRFKEGGELRVNELIKGAWKIEDGDKVIIDVVGEHFELDIIGEGLYHDGTHAIERLE